MTIMPGEKLSLQILNKECILKNTESEYKIFIFKADLSRIIFSSAVVICKKTAAALTDQCSS